MEIFDDVFAGWSFEIGNNIDKEGFRELLNILDTSNFLKIKRITINVTDEPFNSINQTADLCVDCFETGNVLSLSGETMLQMENGVKMVDEVISFLFEPEGYLISIDTYTDAWMPIGCLSNALQIEPGMINSKRLQEVLEPIAQLSFIKKVIPSEKEHFRDYMAHQIGLGLFYKRSIESIPGLEKEDYSKVASFLLSSP